MAQVEVADCDRERCCEEMIVFVVMIESSMSRRGVSTVCHRTFVSAASILAPSPFDSVSLVSPKVLK
jgi:hypothetical protein